MKQEFYLTFTIDPPDGKLDTVVSALSQVFIQIATQVVQQVTVNIAESLLGTIECDECHRRGCLHWKTHHGEKTTFETLFGEIRIPQLQVECTCGHKFYITRHILGIARRKHISGDTEKKLGLLGALTSFRVAAKITSFFGIVMDKMRIWRAVQKIGKTITFNLDPDEKPEAEADGTGIPTVNVKKRGRELKVVVQRKKSGGIRIAGLGIGKYDSDWAGVFAPMLPIIEKWKKFLLVTDGDTSIFNALGNKVKIILQRCLFHIPHQLKHYLWMDKVKHKSPVWFSAMGSIHSICSARHMDGDEATVCHAVAERLVQLGDLIIHCENAGWKHCATYLRNAEPDLFTGVLNRFSGRTTSLVERVMRTINMRINVGKWSETGALNVNKIRLAHYYNGFDA